MESKVRNVEWSREGFSIRMRSKSSWKELFGIGILREDPRIIDEGDLKSF